MRDTVRSAFVAFTERFEGKVPWMYLDVKGLVTVAIGNLVDSPQAVAALPFKHTDGTPASPAEIVAEWWTVKGHQEMALRGGGAFASVTKLRLDDAGIANLVMQRLASNETYIKATFPDWEQWPADAQMAVLSMAWAAGAECWGSFPHFTAAAKKQDWTTCTNECHMDDAHNPGLRPRNVANVQLFQNAQRVATGTFDPSVLYYPSSPIGP